MKVPSRMAFGRFSVMVTLARRLPRSPPMGGKSPMVMVVAGACARAGRLIPQAQSPDTTAFDNLISPPGNTSSVNEVGLSCGRCEHGTWHLGHEVREGYLS